MRDNPFLSDTFVRIWIKHFNTDRPLFNFGFLDNLEFTKPTRLPLYINVGKNLTKGVYYSPNDNNRLEFKNKVFLIYDVPTFFNIDLKKNHKNLGVIRLKQYPGFLVELNTYKDFNHYFSSTFNKSSRYKLTKYKRRLEGCFDISYKELV